MMSNLDLACDILLRVMWLYASIAIILGKMHFGQLTEKRWQAVGFGITMLLVCIVSVYKDFQEGRWPLPF